MAGDLAGGEPAFFAGCMISQTKNDKGLYRLCWPERPSPRRQENEETKEMESAASASVLNIALRARSFACRVTGVFLHDNAREARTP